MLTLKDFIKGSLREIADGLQEFQEDYREKGFSPFPKMTNLTSNLNDSGFVLVRRGEHELDTIMTVTFDVAVTASAQKDAKVGAGISVMSAKVEGGGVVSKRDENTSRISFKIPLKLPEKV